ncbi:MULTISPECIES: hypothetical protein [unclassified Methylobacterium]|uniref:hypothetical protein n=1 Tax=unclassified Methylobacterium TaxID=2615210 RepID=UPI0011C1EE26|nr:MULTISPECIES: hypothetical protein [unclassified Methylobacterium]QEE42299.1 hypothetical protein FVA80_28620 [Methylobacterium sp. WL1]TXN03540.1 hypothetical protein FV242_10565 [Methylobacterium sp. WL64]TXN54212.1 hypothetical protein FV241_25045 [Methylobacterium sp. WL2]
MPEDKPSRRKPKAGAFEPFADDASVRTIGALSFENGTDRIALHGALDLTRDKAGLAQARLLQATLDAIVKALEAGDLPDVVAEAPDAAPKSVANPFA